MKKLSTQNFIDKAKLVHGNKYSYDKTVYVDYHSSLLINCGQHGEFSQRASDHLSGKGCINCAQNKPRDYQEFLTAAVIEHGLNYEYDYYENVRNRDKIKIKCKIHGCFIQSVKDHLSGKGCAKCGRIKSDINRIKSTYHFIEKCKAIHNDRYDYSATKYEGWNKYVLINCKNHGSFRQLARAHLSGQGCSECTIYGFNRCKECFVYFLLSNEEGCIKVGITNSLKTRIRDLKRVTPFNFELIKSIKMTGEKGCALERWYHKSYESAQKSGFSGATEWIKYSKELMNDLSKR